MVNGFGNDFGNDFGNGLFGIPLFISGNIGNNAKLEEDSYRVYVNNDFVGSKVLYTQVEKIEDINKYLQNQGFNDFNTKLDGNRYSIRSEGTEAKHMKDTLQVYLHNR